MHANWKLVWLLGWAHEVPLTEMTSEVLEERIAPLLAKLEVPRGTLAEKTGVHARRGSEPDEAGDMRRAIDDSLEQEQLTPELWVPLTMGWGAVAWVLGSSRVAPGAASIDRCLTRNLAERSELCVGRVEDDGRLTIRANGAGILRQGCALMATTFADAQRSGATLEQVFMHQVGVAHVKAVEKALSFTMHPRSGLLRELGNTGPVGMPLALARAADADALSPGSVTVLGAGSGLSASMMSLTWGASS